MEENIYKGLDLSKVTQYDLKEIHPDFTPLLISPERECMNEELRVLQLKTFAEKYKITELIKKLKDLYADKHPDFF